MVGVPLQNFVHYFGHQLFCALLLQTSLYSESHYFRSSGSSARFKFRTFDGRARFRALLRRVLLECLHRPIRFCRFAGTSLTFCSEYSGNIVGTASGSRRALLWGILLNTPFTAMVHMRSIKLFSKCFPPNSMAFHRPQQLVAVSCPLLYPSVPRDVLHLMVS